MFNKFIRKPKGSKGSKQEGNEAAPVTLLTKEVSEVRPVANNTLAALPLAPSNGFEILPALRDVPSSDRPLLFRKKLALCSILYDFSNPTKHTKEKDLKRQTLQELVDFGTSKLNETALEETFRMIYVNLFRSLPVPPHDGVGAGEAFDPEEDEPSMDPSWLHLQPVYEFLLRYLISQDTDVKLAKRYIDHSFVLRLLDLFDTEDPRERDFLKTILHRIYGKFMIYRPFIRKAINNIFYCFILETEKHNGIGELLEILGSIINGFALPLKEEHKLFLVRALIPLHKPKCYGLYSQQLTYCITQFVEKDFKLADTVIRGLLKFWPVTNSHKEVLLIGELEEVLEATQAAEFQRCMVPLFRQIGRSLNSSHFQVAERALLLWNNDHVISLVAQNSHVILPLIFSALEKNATSHWNQAVHGLTQNVRKMFQELDIQLFQECTEAYLEEEAEAKSREQQRDAVWKRLEAVAAANTSTAGLVLVT
eukprot:c17009_g1_i1 orf=319-1758(+)